MIKFSEIEKLFSPLKLDIAYFEFEDEPKVPFLSYLSTGSDDVEADDSNYFGIEEVRLELYADYRDLSLEQKIIKILNENEAVPEIDFFKNDLENLFVTAFTFEVERS